MITKISPFINNAVQNEDDVVSSCVCNASLDHWHPKCLSDRPSESTIVVKCCLIKTTTFSQKIVHATI